MRAILEFDLPEEQEAYEAAVNGFKYEMMLDEVGQQVFRPARKHGYMDRSIQELLDKIGDDGYELISKLEGLFYDIRNED